MHAYRLMLDHRRSPPKDFTRGFIIPRLVWAAFLAYYTADHGADQPDFGAWRGGRVVECTALEMRHRCKPIGGSNPSLSATKSLILQEKLKNTKLRRDFRRLATKLALVGH